MSTCNNCGTKLSCGCQKRTLADGTSGCTKCVTSKQVPTKKPTGNTSVSIKWAK